MTSPNPARLYPAAGLQLSVKLVQSGQTAVVVLGGLGPSSQVTTATAEAWRDAFWSRARTFCHSSVTLTGATMRDVSQAEGVTVEVGPGTTPTAVGGGTAAVAAAAFLVRWQTEGGGRSRKGRSFIPGVAVTDTQADGRTLATTTATTITTAMNAYTAAFSSGGIEGIEPAILSFTKGYATAVVGASVAPRIGIQRRRMRD